MLQLIKNVGGREMLFVVGFDFLTRALLYGRGCQARKGKGEDGAGAGVDGTVTIWGQNREQDKVRSVLPASEPRGSQPAGPVVATHTPQNAGPWTWLGWLEQEMSSL